MMDKAAKQIRALVKMQNERDAALALVSGLRAEIAELRKTRESRLWNNEAINRINEEWVEKYASVLPDDWAIAHEMFVDATDEIYRWVLEGEAFEKKKDEHIASLRSALAREKERVKEAFFAAIDASMCHDWVENGFEQGEAEKEWQKFLASRKGE